MSPEWKDSSARLITLCLMSSVLFLLLLVQSRFPRGRTQRDLAVIPATNTAPGREGSVAFERGGKVFTESLHFQAGSDCSLPKNASLLGTRYPLCAKSTGE